MKYVYFGFLLLAFVVGVAIPDNNLSITVICLSVISMVIYLRINMMENAIMEMFPKIKEAKKNGKG